MALFSVIHIIFQFEVTKPYCISTIQMQIIVYILLNKTTAFRDIREGSNPAAADHLRATA